MLRSYFANVRFHFLPQTLRAQGTQTLCENKKFSVISVHSVANLTLPNYSAFDAVGASARSRHHNTPPGKLVSTMSK